MGTIKIGQGGKKVFFYPGAVPVLAGAEKRRAYTPEEKRKLIESIKTMPKSKWVSALRSAGLTAEAAECEHAIAEEIRHKRFVEIMKIEDDVKRMKALIADGFEDEASNLAAAIEEANAAAESVSDAEKADATIEAAGNETEDEGNIADGDETAEQEEAAAPVVNTVKRGRRPRKK